MFYTGISNMKNSEYNVYIGRTAKKLPLGLDKWNHSPTGFCWGYAGSGPTQLAKAMLFDFAKRNGIVEPAVFADTHAYTFKSVFIAKIPQSCGFVITDENIGDFFKNLTIKPIVSNIVTFEADYN